MAVLSVSLIDLFWCGVQRGGDIVYHNGERLHKCYQN